MRFAFPSRSALAGFAFGGLALALLLGPAPSASADVIHLNTGGVLRGEIVKETEDEVQVKTLAGITTVFRGDIERIERDKGPRDVLLERRKKLAKDDAQGHFELSQWAKKARLDDEAKALLEEVVRIAPNHQGARQELGFVLRQGEWVTAEAAKRLDKERGERPEGDEAQDQQALEAALRARNVAPSLRTELGSLRKGLTHRDATERQRAQQALLTLPARRYEAAVQEATAKGVEPPAREQTDAEVQSASVVLLEEIADKLRRGTLRSRARELQALCGLDKIDRRNLEARQKQLERWQKAKDEAVEVIFDLTIYPDENHGKAGQPTVDEKVKVVEAEYARYEPVLLGDLGELIRRPESDVAARLAGWEQARDALAEVEQTLRALGGTPSAEPPPGPSAAALTLLIYRAGRVGEARARAGDLTPWEREMLQRLSDIRVSEYNDKVLANRSPDKGQAPTQAEREQVRITNAYRIQMGRAAIEIHPCLVQSARAHSAEMTRLGYFEHESPVEENRTPSKRAQKAGYPGGAAENISLGSIAPKATHDAWYNSSGHHRNILSPGHKAMGSGQDGKHWTQNFGSNGQLER